MLMWPRSEPLPPHWLTVHTQNNIIKINEDQRLASPSHGRRSRQYGRICTIAAARMESLNQIFRWRVRVYRLRLAPAFRIF